MLHTVSNSVTKMCVHALIVFIGIIIKKLLKLIASSFQLLLCVPYSTE